MIMLLRMGNAEAVYNDLEKRHIGERDAAVAEIIGDVEARFIRTRRHALAQRRICQCSVCSNAPGRDCRMRLAAEYVDAHPGCDNAPRHIDHVNREPWHYV